MFCPKCGGSNPDNGKFCRSCGQDLTPVSFALRAKDVQTSLSCNNKKGITIEGAVTKIFMGVAFMVVAGILGWTGMAGGRSWWFWLLIPAFGMIGTGVAHLIQMKTNERARLNTPSISVNTINEGSVNALPPTTADNVNAGSRYRTGDLAPPSVTDRTTRHLDLDKEGRTMTLPQK